MQKKVRLLNLLWAHWGDAFTLVSLQHTWKKLQIKLCQKLGLVCREQGYIQCQGSSPAKYFSSHDQVSFISHLISHWFPPFFFLCSCLMAHDKLRANVLLKKIKSFISIRQVFCYWLSIIYGQRVQVYKLPLVLRRLLLVETLKQDLWCFELNDIIFSLWIMKEMSNISDRYQERDETFVSQKNLLEVSPGIISVKRKRI